VNTAGHRLAFALLALLAAVNINLKTRQSVSLPRFDPDDETAYFRAESALQYRYARLAASGTAIPQLDRDAQYPEGIRTPQELTLMMETATGWTWRALNLFTPLKDLRWFVLLWSAVLASLSIPALYAVALKLSRSPPLALASASVFALSWAGMSNGIGTYGFESFALPLMLGNLAFLTAALDLENSAWRWHAAAAGALMTAALASWHFAGFHLAALFLALAWTGWRRRGNAPDLTRLRVATAALLACACATGLVCAPLRETGFCLSPMMILGYGLLLALLFPARAVPVALGTAAALGLSVRLVGSNSAYGHVYGLLLEKLRHGLIEPADPALLSPDARLLWVGPFKSPDPGFALFAFLPLCLIILPRLISTLCGEREQQPEKGGAPVHAVDAMLILYLFGTAMVARLTPVLAFLLCAAACRLPQRWLRTAWLPLLFFGFAAMEGAKSLAPSSRFNPFLRLSAAWTGPEHRPVGAFSDELALIHWLRKNGGPDRPVLANYGISASLLTYAGSPILLQPKFEAPGIRAKTREFFQALYGTEADFFAFCRRYGAALFVYSTDDLLDETPDGPRYNSGDLRLRADAAAVLFHFHTEQLKDFRLLYENPGFRVFSLSIGQKKAASASTDPIYDITRFSPRVKAGGWLDLDVAGVNERMGLARRYRFLARILARLGRGEESLSAYEAAFTAWPPDKTAQEEAFRLRNALKASGS